MALLKLSGMASAISGKIGGSIFATTSNGSVVKQNAYAQQHASPRQSRQRTRLYPVTQLWRTLTPSEQSNWAAAVIDYPYTNRVGDTVYYTGYQLFTLLNSNLLNVNRSLIMSPPTFVAIADLTISLNTFDSSTVWINFASHDLDADMIFYMSPPQWNQLQPKLSRFVQTRVTYQGVTSGFVSLLGFYAGIFGVPPTNSYAWVYAKQVNRTTGLPSGKSNLLIGQFT